VQIRYQVFVSDIAIFVLTRDVKLQLTNSLSISATAVQLSRPKQ